MASDFIVVTTSVDSIEIAKHLQGLLLMQRLAACVQIAGPVESQYWWKTVLETTLEWTLVIKTKAILYEQLEAFLVDHHPYDTPEILAVPVLKGQARYLAWMDSELRLS